MNPRFCEDSEACVAFGLGVFSQEEPIAFPTGSVRIPEAHVAFGLGVFSQGEPLAFPNSSVKTGAVRQRSKCIFLGEPQLSPQVL